MRRILRVCIPAAWAFGLACGGSRAGEPPAPANASPTPAPSGRLSVGTEGLPPRLAAALVTPFRGVLSPTVAVAQPGERGDQANPILANGPQGQQEYLGRLICPSGGPPDFTRIGSYGAGPDGHIVDGYAVFCPPSGPTYRVFIDMYHRDRDTVGVGPFKAHAVLPILRLAGCPPEVTTLGLPADYVFGPRETARRMYVVGPLADTIIAEGAHGTPRVWLTVDATGRARPDFESDLKPGDVATARALRQLLDTLQWHPAEHHPGCPVPQWLVVRFRFDSVRVAPRERRGDGG